MDEIDPGEFQKTTPLTWTQRAELDRRLQAYQQNPREGSSWPEVMARLRGEA